ncbi:hypothetical protein BKA70DRAFT_1249548 [Coprinopsis sp. MPI-PUGE-AT-0042]|nr:hypothetical protein BKA70DRAFT_1249548 [Coprinopsis sp. MPI-PUGE-AT-0042]
MSASDSEASSLRSSSASLEDDIVVPPTTSKKAGKAKANQSGPRNEGTDPSWAFKPPPGRVLYFDWDALNANDDLELCLIRVPDAVKTKYLQGLEISLPSSSSKSTKVGSLKKKHATFDVWSMGSEASDDVPIAGEEINTLTCLLPRKKKGTFVAGSIAHRLVLSAQAVTPTPAAPENPACSGPKNQEILEPPKTLLSRRAFDTLVQALRLLPTTSKGTEESTDIDVPEAPQKDKKATQKAKDTEEDGEDESKKKEKKSKKRKTAPEEPVEDASVVPKKKSKKTKSS